MEREAAYTFGDDAGSYQCVFVYRDSASVFGCKDHSATMIVNLIGLLIAPQDTILVMASWLLLGLCRRAGIQRRKRRTGKTAWTERRLLYGFLVVAFLFPCSAGNGKMLHSRQRS